MIVRYRSSIVGMLLTWKGSVLKKIYPTLILLFLFSWVIYIFNFSFPDFVFPLKVSAFTLVGISLAIFLGFCNTAAYDRFWEGRKLWGSLVIHARSLSLQIIHFVKEDERLTAQDKAYPLQLISAFAYALNAQLRKTDPDKELSRLLPAEFCEALKGKKFKTACIVGELTRWVQEQQLLGRIDSIEKCRIDDNINELSVVLGGCERIVHTRIPFVYFVLLHRTVYIYCFILPFGLLESITWAMPFFVTFVAYSFMALDAIVDEISEPFGKEDNDLALDHLCQTIEYTINELGGFPLPEIQRVNKSYVLN